MFVVDWLRGLSSGAWKVLAGFVAVASLVLFARRGGVLEGERKANQAAQERALDVARQRAEANGHPLSDDEVRRWLTPPKDRP
jgi:hypothetical protein